MNKKTNRNNHPQSENLPDSQPPASAPQQEDPVFADLQALWDEQTRRIDHLLATHPEALPIRLNPHHRRPWRRRVMAEYLILALLNSAAATYSLLALLPDPYILIRISGIILAATTALLAAHSLWSWFAIRRHHPARVPVARMSRFIRRMHMEPHYAPRPDKHRKPRGHSVNDAAPAVQNLNSPFSIFNYPQVAAVSAAALIVLTAISCTPVGDGHAMSTADPAARAAAIEHVDSMIAQI
ncbi:MAG: hypothetical protein J6I49_09170 [Bacteroidales bacterium]|nr:hypothetical protein [Bacteroidales bacterium]